MSLVLARKYRPQYFRDVIGQDIFVHMIQNALQQDRVGQGILLTGIRGVGKTTLARLIAKALTCLDRKQSIEPCGTCVSCESIIQERHLDVLEIDAASYTSIDDIRQILESCNYQAVMSAYKIFIIDEVHMLSKSAFNALLKTLEEPPAHVKFILATTETNKVPLTVVSRCQQFHLKRLTPEILTSHLEFVCQQENFKFELDALSLVSRHSDGSVRDSLSILERVLLLAADSKLITLSLVQEILGIPNKDQVNELINAVVENNTDVVLNLARELYHKGLDPQSVLREMLSAIHEKTIECLQNDLSAISKWDRLWQITQKGLLDANESHFPLAGLEMILLRLSYIGQFPTPSDILTIIEQPPRIEKQEKAIKVNADSINENLISKESFSKNLKIQPIAQPTQEKENTPSVEQYSFEALLTALQKHREILLHTNLTRNVSFISWKDNVLELSWLDSTPSSSDFAKKLEKFIFQWLKTNHRVTFEITTAGTSWHQQQNEKLQQKASANPLVQDVQSMFPGCIIESVGKP